MDDAKALALFGTTQPVPASRTLRVGHLSCEFCEGSLRDVQWSGVEIVRGIAYLLRDRDWGTVPAIVSNVAIQESPARFELRFSMTMHTPAAILRATALVEGHADGRLAFEVHAASDSDLDTNRCGFVVLHPAAAAGQPLQVEHTDGSTSEARFPFEVSPSQPVFDIRSLSYSPAASVVLRIRLEAELPGEPAGKFEMEDQRNWSDASFKTYVGSLLDRWPYRLPAKQTMSQRVSIFVRGSDAVSGEPVTGESAAVKIGAARGAVMPAIGVGVPAGIALAHVREHAALRELGATWWVVEIALDDPGHRADLETVARLREGIQPRVRLDVIVPETLAPDAAASLARSACDSAELRVEGVRLLPAPYLKSFQPTDRWPDLPPLEAYAAAARACFSTALVGGGMFTCFTELNRKRPPRDALDFIGHATFPIVHAADDEAVMQTIECLPHIARSVRTLWPGLPYHLGPSTLAMRRNPYGDLPVPNPDFKRLALASADPRHDAEFGAAWTAAYAASVAPLGIDALALHESHGPSGPFGRSAPRISSTTSAVPAWEMLRRLAEATGAPIMAIEHLPRGVSGLAWRRSDGKVAGVVVNRTSRPIALSWGHAVEAEDLDLDSRWDLAPFQGVSFEVGNDETQTRH